MQTVRTAVFPVAGLGTRFLPATKATPKEMLPVVDRPLIQYAVDEAIAAGIEQMIFVTGRNKNANGGNLHIAFRLETGIDRKTGVEGKGVAGRVESGGGRCMRKKKK